MTNINDKARLSKIQRIDKNIEGQSIFLGKCSKKMNKETWQTMTLRNAKPH